MSFTALVTGHYSFHDVSSVLSAVFVSNLLYKSEILEIFKGKNYTVLYRMSVVDSLYWSFLKMFVVESIATLNPLRHAACFSVKALRTPSLFSFNKCHSRRGLVSSVSAY